MYADHPWRDDELGAFLYKKALWSGGCFTLKFDCDLRPFVGYCRAGGLSSNQTMMKILTRLSADHLPQYILSVRQGVHRARYPAGYVRPVRPGAEMLEHVCVREKSGGFVERPIRDQMMSIFHWFARRAPRFSVFMSRWPLDYFEVKDHYALMVSRNPLKGSGLNYHFHSSPYRSCTLNIPYGDVCTLVFGAPYAFGPVDHYEPFLMELRRWLEDPEKIPAELIGKPYREVWAGAGSETVDHG